MHGADEAGLSGVVAQHLPDLGDHHREIGFTDEGVGPQVLVDLVSGSGLRVTESGPLGTWSLTYVLAESPR